MASLFNIRKAEHNRCPCEVAQSAVHILRCKLVGEGRGRNLLQAEKDRYWSAEVFSFLHENIRRGGYMSSLGASD